jgi:hypothetical protein
MMTLSRGFRGDAGTPEHTATHVAAAALIVTTVPTAIRASTTAPASAARASASPSRTSASGYASPSPSPMKHFSVPRAAEGPAGALANIAARTLGAVFAAAGLGTGLSRRRTGVPDRLRRAPPGWNLRQATELAP